ncbi:MAG: hypothetical protein AVDCRST_MAG35-1721, partial [uncultured Quadrisphaera sp.]
PVRPPGQPGDRHRDPRRAAAGRRGGAGRRPAAERAGDGDLRRGGRRLRPAARGGEGPV